MPSKNSSTPRDVFVGISAVVIPASFAAYFQISSRLTLLISSLALAALLAM